MKRTPSLLLSITAVTGLLFGFNNCSPLHDPDTASNSSASLDITSLNAQKAQQVLANNCTICHGSAGGMGGVSNITDLAGLVTQNLIVPGNSASSALYQAVHSGQMPPGNPLLPADVASLQTWIDNALIAPPTPGPTPSPTPGGGGVDMTTYTYISQNILNNCVGCHGASTQSGGYRFDSYANTMMAVQARNLSGSLLYTETASGDMPQGGPILQTSQIEAIGNWIQNGAPNN